MESLIVENVRCFRKRQEVPLAPLTLLVGENSTGKSTFLALVRLAWDLAAGKLPLDFNEEPFLLGAFSQIASSKRGRSAQTKSFVLGGCFDVGPEKKERRSSACMSGEFRSSNGRPSLSTATLSWENLSLLATIDESDIVSELRISRPGGGEPAIMPSRAVEGYSLHPPRPSLLLLFDLILVDLERGKVPRGGLSGVLGHQIRMMGRPVSGLKQRPFAFAPIRTRPLRTYDPIRDTPGPEGTHIPMLLAQIYMQNGEPSRRLREAVEAFGKASGLFTSLDVRTLGKGSGDPFQIQIHIDAQPVNIMDVGYGVSQALPIIVDCLRGPDEATFLLQQPEVHLHPRAQAELGSFFGALAKGRNQRFVIETHSDYLVDRVRMDIRDGKSGLRPEDVSVLYFERKSGEVEISRLEIDAQGNIVDPPPGYRRFFLEEERRFLGGW